MANPVDYDTRDALHPIEKSGRIFAPSSFPQQKLLSVLVADCISIVLSCTYNGSSGYLMRQFVDVSRSTHRTRADVFGTSTLRRGNEGRYVYNLQHYLNRHGAGLTCDGIFGGGTETAVINYQSNNGLDADGLAGANTKDSLLQKTPQ